MLLKGVNKRVIIIKNPESEIFEEAYFIVKSGNIKGVFKQSKENEMVIEANRIISDYHNQQRSIIEKNGIASSIGGDLSELDSFLNSGAKNKNDTISKINKAGNISGNIESIRKAEKNKKDNKSNNSNNPTEAKNTQAARLPDEEIFEDEKFFGNMRGNTEKYGNFDFAGYEYEREKKPYRPAFRFISSKRIRIRNIPVPPKSFFVGVGFMSAVIILIKLFEIIVLN